MSKYTIEKLLEAMTQHRNISDRIPLYGIWRVIKGDLIFLQDAIINGDTILCKEFDSAHSLNADASYYKVKPDYETISFLGVEIPKPLTKYPDEGEEYYYKDGINKVGYSYWHWDNHRLDKLRFKYGIWTSKKHAEIAIELINKVLEINHEN